MKKIKRYHRIGSLLVSVVLFIIPFFVMSASAQGIDYLDYIVDITENENGESVVKIEYPLTEMYSSAWSGDSLLSKGNQILEFDRTTTLQQVAYFYFCKATSANVINAQYIPADSVVSFDIDTSSYGSQIADLYCSIDDIDSSGGIIKAYKGSTVKSELNGSINLNCTFIKNEGTTAFRPCVVVIFPAVSYTGEFPPPPFQNRIEFKHCYVTMRISSLVLQQAQTGKTNEILKAVESKLEANGQRLDDVISTQQQTNEKLDSVVDQQQQTNEKLDDVISGGEPGDQLIAGNDKLEQAGAGMQEDLDQIQDFEDQYMGDLENNLDDIVAGADLTFLFPSLDFIQRYINKIVAGVPSKYLVVFTLPMLFGIVMYILGHPIRAPRPDTSGDEVTRETFTTTTILEGRHAGSTTKTRTVTTSSEIGRVHRE